MWFWHRHSSCHTLKTQDWCHVMVTALSWINEWKKQENSWPKVGFRDNKAPKWMRKYGHFVTFIFGKFHWKQSWRARVLSTESETLCRCVYHFNSKLLFFRFCFSSGHSSFCSTKKKSHGLTKHFHYRLQYKIKAPKKRRLTFIANLSIADFSVMVF